ncbi:MAG TPA: ATP-binding protein [Methylomirabilota bacterium]|nr:ATP-binding protein [Methylomirabilota bacterium]
MRATIRRKLVLLSLLILVVVSFAFTLLHHKVSRAWVEEDLRERAVTFAREIAATIGDRREFESGPLLQRQIRDIMAVRGNVLQLDVLELEGGQTRVVATSHSDSRLPFTRKEADQVRLGRVVSRLIDQGSSRYWEVIAPVTLGETVAGAVAAKFSLDRADALAARISMGAFLLTAASVVVMGLLMSVAVYAVVDRPLRRFLHTIDRVRHGDTRAALPVTGDEEFAVLGRHFNEMVLRIQAFNDELQARIDEATHQLQTRYQEVEHLNELLFSMQRSLSHAERLALSGRIVAEIAHEVGTPLHSIAGHLELLRQDVASGASLEATTRRLNVVESQLARVSEIITQLLDLTRRPPGEAAPVDVNALVRSTAELVRPGLTAAGLTLELALTPDLPRVRGHGGQLQQVVLNLLTNAIDATPPGGRVRLTTANGRDPDGLEIEVSDTGTGIPEPDRKSIFEPFFSTKEPGRGTGLGLFISAQIVREHRGRIELDSAEGRGSRFRVLLPAGPQAA